MAKSRVTTNPMYTGGAGGYSFYVRGGEQVIRQRKNNSNYGEGASRTMAQMIRRIRWGNLVNVFKSQKSWQPKAYDSKTKGQTDYNIFMALNINQATVGFTKEMCEAGCAVIEAYQVSRGSLPPISLTPSGSGNNYVTDIKISNAIQGGTTVGQLAADILANNSQFVDGDNIAFIFFKNWKTSRTEWPYAASVYAEVTLDTTSTTVINSIPALDNRLSKSTNGFLQASWSSAGEFDPSREVGFVAIHTRKSASMLAVSSQEILMNSNSFVSQFSGAEWDLQCVLSYGLSNEVPLDPNFPEGVVTSVTANGTELRNNDSLSGSQLLVIEGDGVSADNVKVIMNGTPYVPLITVDSSLSYILSVNGSCEIWSGNRKLMTVFVQDVEYPEGFPVRINCYQATSDSPVIPQEGLENPILFDNAYYANYPYVASGSLTNFLFRFQTVELDQEELTFHNCTKKGFALAGSNTHLNVAPTDNSAVAWVGLGDLVLAVFNYN